MPRRMDMKVRVLPDWFPPLLAWTLTIAVLGAAATLPKETQPDGALVSTAPLLAVAWTCGFIGMRRFKQRFPVEHESLGRPMLFGSPYERRQWRFVGYLLGFRFIRLGDAVVSVGFAAFVILTLIGIVSLLSLLGKN